MTHPVKRHRLKKLNLTEISLCDVPACSGAQVAIYKRGSAQDGGYQMDINALAEQMTAATEVIAKLEAQLTEERTEREKLSKQVAEAKSDPEPQKISSSPEIAAELERLRKANEDAALRLAKLDEREEVETFTKRARAQYGMLPIRATALGDILRKASKAMAPEDFAELERLLKSADAALSDRVRGIGSGTQSPIGSAEAEIEKAAKEHASKTNTTFAKAYQDVITAQPELYERYLSERGDVQ